jgi:hypothetical protein
MSFAVGEQLAIGGDLGTVELELGPAAENGPRGAAPCLHPWRTPRSRPFARTNTVTRVAEVGDHGINHSAHLGNLGSDQIQAHCTYENECCELKGAGSQRYDAWRRWRLIVAGRGVLAPAIPVLGLRHDHGRPAAATNFYRRGNPSRIGIFKRAEAHPYPPSDRGVSHCGRAVGAPGRHDQTES